ncbi:MAG TPA: hypothetical protein VMV22_04490 [Acidimicrobiales bacterium]|nr:hypothetical protein [Acidimicrobiales bacterium]
MSSEPRDGGYTLVETALTVLVMAIVLAAAFPIVPVFFRESTTVQNTYNSLDQLVLASEVVTRFVHEAVDPAPGGSASPFLSASANAVTFYANTGNANGPEKVVVSVTSSATGRAFSADIYTAQPNTCPFAANPGGTCNYGSASATRSILLINYLTNGTGGSPVFTYTLQGGGTCGGPPPGSGGTTLRSGTYTAGTRYTTPTLSVNALTNPVTSGDTIVLGSGVNTQDLTATATEPVSATSIPVSTFTANATYSSGASVLDNACTSTQLAQITAVGITLQATKNPGGQPTGYQSLAYLFSPNYNATVG